MDKNTLLLGKVLGEIYRIQQHTKTPCSANEPDIYGLLHGFEHVIEEQLEKVGFVSDKQVEYVTEVLDAIDQDEKKLDKFKGFNDIERKLKDGGVNRVTAIKILRYLNANSQFTNVIEKMNSSSSPVECKKFVLSKYDS